MVGLLHVTIRPIDDFTCSPQNLEYDSDIHTVMSVRLHAYTRHRISWQGSGLGLVHPRELNTGSTPLTREVKSTEIIAIRARR